MRSCFVSGGWKPLSLEAGKAVDSMGVVGRGDDASEEDLGVTRLQLKAVQGRLGGLSSQLKRSTALKKKFGKSLMVEGRHGGDVYEKLKAVPADKERYEIPLHDRARNGPGCSTSTKGAGRGEGWRKMVAVL